jgi:hypothetical protein
LRIQQILFPLQKALVYIFDTKRKIKGMEIEQNKSAKRLEDKEKTQKRVNHKDMKTET